MFIINDIADAIRAVEGVKLLNVDPGEATNRTVMTFAGAPAAVVQAAFAAVARASELIDMRAQTGAHPRLGTVDVLPLVPVSGISLAECAHLARELAERIARELSIPIYCYEAAALSPLRKKLEDCRRGQYEALPERVMSADAPDFGARPYDELMARTGAINLGARDFLIAVNFNLNTKSIAIASQIAADVRESGRKGSTPGALKACKAIGWFIDEYDIAQVSMNLTDISVSPLHIAFEEVCRTAQKYGAKVTGTEIIGLVPRRVLLEAGAYFAPDSQLNGDELIDAAINTLRLNDLCPFDAKSRILESLLGNMFLTAAHRQ